MSFLRKSVAFGKKSVALEQKSVANAYRHSSTLVSDAPQLHNQLPEYSQVRREHTRQLPTHVISASSSSSQSQGWPLDEASALCLTTTRESRLLFEGKTRPCCCCNRSRSQSSHLFTGYNYSSLRRTYYQLRVSLDNSESTILSYVTLRLPFISEEIKYIISQSRYLSCLQMVTLDYQ